MMSKNLGDYSRVLVLGYPKARTRDFVSGVTLSFYITSMFAAQLNTLLCRRAGLNRIFSAPFPCLRHP